MKYFHYYLCRQLKGGGMEIFMKRVLKNFNNLSKRIAYNIYFISNLEEEKDKNTFISKMNTIFNAKKLSEFSQDLAKILDADVLNVSYFDYYPFGASSNSLICNKYESDNYLICSECVSVHLDKSHISIHTYPEKIDDIDIVTFRIDIELSTCGEILPLTAIDFVINFFKADVYVVEYSIRGYTRDKCGKKIFIDEKLKPLKDYISKSAKTDYNMFSEVSPRMNYAYLIASKNFEAIDNNIRYTELDTVKYSKVRIINEIEELVNAQNLEGGNEKLCH